MRSALNKHSSVNHTTLYSVANDVNDVKVFCGYTLAKRSKSSHFSRSDSDTKKTKFCKACLKMLRFGLVKAKSFHVQDFWVSFVSNRYNHVFLVPTWNVVKV